jgi:KDO2-lipid IV(A) lauroyltransferase
VLYQLDRAFFATLLWLIRLLPVDRASRFGAAIGRNLGPRFRKSRALAANLRIVLPDASESEIMRIARESWGNAGAVFAEYAHVGTIARPGSGRIECVVLGDIETLRDPSRPAIFVGAHQANWEMMAAAISGRGIRLAALFSPPTNPLLDGMLRYWRAGLGCDMLPRDESMRPMIKALGQGTSLGIVADRRVDSGKPVPLFGHEMATSLIPARLALRFGHDLVPVRTERLKDAHFRVTFHPPIAAPSSPADEIERAVLMTRELHRHFEQWIIEKPGQWFCSKRLWPRAVYGGTRALQAQTRSRTFTNEEPES